MQDIEKRIAQLKEEKNAVILAHYYQTGDIIDIADMVGDSYGLSRKAKETDADMIVFCGVKFMAESAKILSPEKKVLLPVPDAGCPLADMVTSSDIERLRREYPGSAVVCYVNSTAEVKAESDICVTSANAVDVVKSLKEERVVFVPDQNLGHYVAEKVPEKEIIPFSGYCIVHHQVSVDDVKKVLDAAPDALLLVHPECTPDVVNKADFVGSTAQIIRHVQQSNHKKFIIGTEMGILHVLKKKNPDKEFYLLTPKLYCTNMKKTKRLDVLHALQYGQHEITLPKKIMERAKKSLDRMLAV